MRKITVAALHLFCALTLAMQADAQSGKGMTWKMIGTNSPTGTVRVGCATSCDAYQGDTPCTTALPLLCIKKTGAGFPLPLPATVDNSSQYYRWSGGIIGTTSPTVPPTTLAAANALCVQVFGADWRVAEHHDGWGWQLQAYGGVGDPAKRFWVHINDQPGATCWHNAPIVTISNLPMQGGNEKTPCPALGVIFKRSDAASVPYLGIMLPNLDQQCASKGAGLRVDTVKFLKCAPDPRGTGFGPNASADITCAK